MASFTTPTHARYQRGGEPQGDGALVKIVALFLGIAVAVLITVAVVSAQAADEARDEAKAVAGTSHSAESSAVSLPLAAA